MLLLVQSLIVLNPFSRLEYPETREEEEMVEKTQQNLDNYAKQGLRVLVMAKRVLPEEEYMEWLAKHRDAEVFGRFRLRECL